MTPSFLQMFQWAALEDKNVKLPLWLIKEEIVKAYSHFVLVSYFAHFSTMNMEAKYSYET
jgi:hypothetical protein